MMVKKEGRGNKAGSRPLSEGSNRQRVIMNAFVRRFVMHYGIYRRYPLARVDALRNAWRIARA